MIEVYRSWEKVEGANHPEQYYAELCRDCAIQEQQNGRVLQFDGYLSNISPLHIDETCQKCGESFFVDGRKIKEPLNNSK